MSDRITMDIDCDMNRISIFGDTCQSVVVGKQVETTRAYLIAQLLEPHIRQLMSMPAVALQQQYLEIMAKKVNAARDA